MNIERFYQELELVFTSADPERIIKFLHSNLAEADSEGDKHAAVSILNELAGYCRNSSRYAEAVEAVERALMEMRLLGYENTVHYGTTLLNAATAHRVRGESEKALEQFNAALKIFQDELPADDHRLAAVYNNVSSIYEEGGQYAAALQTLQRALDIMLKHTEMKEQAAIVQTNLAMILFKMELEEEALRELENALTLFKDSGGKKPGPHYAAALAGMGEALMRMRKFSEAIEVYEEALEHINSVFGRNRDFAVTCQNCSLAYAALGEDELAEGYRQLAEDIFEKIGRADAGLRAH